MLGLTDSGLRAFYGACAFYDSLLNMKFLARIMMVLGLLGVLAYGSFAFGKYVLSAKLFGEDGKSGGPHQLSRSTTEATAITRQTGWKGNKPRVEVKVLSADQTDSSSELPEFSEEDGFGSNASRSGKKKRDTDQPSRTSTTTSNFDTSDDSGSKPKAIKRNVDEGSVEYSLGNENAKRNSNNNDEDRPRRRRHRKRVLRERNYSQKKAESFTARGEVAPLGDGPESSGSNGDNASSSVSSGSSTRERTTERRRERSRTSSPVPRPESSGGGDSASISPVPQPE